MTFQLAACAEMIFRELPFVERVKEISNAGLMVEIWHWNNKNLQELADTGAVFSSVTGYLEGDLITDDGAQRLLETAVPSLEAAAIINSPRLNLHGTGLDNNGIPVRPLLNPNEKQWEKAVDTLTRMAELAAKHGRVFTLENLNQFDHPGATFGSTADTLELVKRVNHPNLRMNLDLYHTQIGEGDLVRNMVKALDFVGEIQIADVPSRAEPGSGEIYYPFVASELEKVGYKGVVAMEAFASGDSHQALQAFKSAFSN